MKRRVVNALPPIRGRVHITSSRFFPRFSARPSELESSAERCFHLGIVDEGLNLKPASVGCPVDAGDQIPPSFLYQMFLKLAIQRFILRTFRTANGYRSYRKGE
jgi:hypothetical protein